MKQACVVAALEAIVERHHVGYALGVTEFFTFEIIWYSLFSSMGATHA